MLRVSFGEIFQMGLCQQKHLPTLQLFFDWYHEERMGARASLVLGEVDSRRGATGEDKCGRN